MKYEVGTLVIVRGLTVYVGDGEPAHVVGVDRGDGASLIQFVDPTYASSHPTGWWCVSTKLLYPPTNPT